MRFLLILISMMLLGCRPMVKPSDGTPLTAAQIKELETRVGIQLPSDTVVLYSGDGEGKSYSPDYYCWVLGFTNRFTTVHPYGALRHLNARRYIESDLRKGKIPELKEAHWISWKTNGYKFEGFLGCSDIGDYLSIQRTIDKN